MTAYLTILSSAYAQRQFYDEWLWIFEGDYALFLRGYWTELVEGGYV